MRKDANDELAINRHAAFTKFDELRAKYYLGPVHLSMSALTEVSGLKIKATTNSIVTNDVTVPFGAVTDEDVYGVAAIHPK